MDKSTSSSIKEINKIERYNKPTIENIGRIEQTSSNSTTSSDEKINQKQVFAPLFPRIK